MAIRQIRIDGDPILRKKSREVKEVNDRIKVLLDDMVETMYENDGVGLAAPQIGILRQLVVIDIGEGAIKLVNPQIVEKSGEEIDVEGCLSVPEKAGTVCRPKWVKVKYLDEFGGEQLLEGEGLLARALCHEIDHLNGILFTDKIIEEVYTEETEEEEE